jgi:hypothetical protein
MNPTDQQINEAAVAGASESTGDFVAGAHWAIAALASPPEAPAAAGAALAVAWQVRGVGRENGPGEWRYADPEDLDAYRNGPDRWELRPLYLAATPAAGDGEGKA